MPIFHNEIKEIGIVPQNISSFLEMRDIIVSGVLSQFLRVKEA